MNLQDLNPFVPKPTKWARRYKSFRNQNRCVPRIWNTGTTACALGAFLNVRNHREANETGCVAHYMPGWLVNLTPSVFDTSRYGDLLYRYRWADALYMPGGLIERASKLDEREREAMWDDARKRLNELVLQSRKCCSLSHDFVSRVVSSARYGNWVVIQATPENAQRAAGSIITAIDDALVAAGA